MKYLFTILLSILFLWVYNYAQAEKAYKKNLVDKKLDFRDLAYENSFRTILLYPLAQLDNPLYRQMLSPIIELNGDVPLFVEFDYLTDKYDTFRARIFHADANWQQSVLNEVEYLSEYNDFPIFDYKL